MGTPQLPGEHGEIVTTARRPTPWFYTWWKWADEKLRSLTTQTAETAQAVADIQPPHIEAVWPIVPYGTDQNPQLALDPAFVDSVNRPPLVIPGQDGEPGQDSYIPGQPGKDGKDGALGVMVSEEHYHDDSVTIIQQTSGTSSSGDVVGPASATADAVVLFDGTTGKLVKDSTKAYTPTGIGLGNVTNDAQTKAAIVPNTAPSAGQILVGNAGGTAYAPVSVSGDITMTSAGVVSLSAPVLFACTVSANSLADNNSAQNVFPSAVDTFTAEASTSYWLDAEIFITTGGGTYSVGFGLAGTATLTSIGYRCMGVKAASGALSVNINNRWVTTASNTTVTSSNTTAGAILSIRGIIRVNGAGTLIPQITFSAAPGGTNQVEPNSFLRLQKMGTNTVASFGAWA